MVSALETQMDLFQVRGVLIEKEQPALDLFSIRGVVIEKQVPAVNIPRARILLAQDTKLNANIQFARVLVAQTQEGYVNIPTDITGIDRFKIMAQAKLSKTLDWSSITISQPVPQPDGAASLTDVTLTTQEPSIYRGEIKVSYRRRSLSVLNPLKYDPAAFADIPAVIEAIRSEGYLVSDVDIDVAASTITPERITLVAAPNSFFFYPGSKAIFGAPVALPEISTAFSSSTLPGFEWVSQE